MQGKESEGAGVKRGGDGISLRELPGGKWETRWWNEGRWVRRRAASKDDAEALAQAERDRRAAVAKARDKEQALQRKAAARGDFIVGLLDMDIEGRQAVMLALAKLKAAGASAAELPVAVEEWVAAHLAAGRVPVGSAVQEHVRALEEAGRGQRTVQDREWRLSSMAKALGADTALSAVTRAMVAEWIDKAAVSSRPHRYRAAGAFFRWAFGKGMVQRNPMEGMRMPDVRGVEEPRILSPDETRRVLDAARRVAPGMVAYFAVGIFAGLRPERELGELTWEDIDLKERKIWVPMGRSKTHRQRAVPISDNLAAWLEAVPAAERHGAVAVGRRKMRGKVIRESKVRWQNDIMRHTRVSFRLAELGGDVARVALEGGHSPAIIARHYANMRIKREDVEAFWRIYPPKAGLKG